VAIGGVVFGVGSALGSDDSVQSGYALTFLYMMHPMEMLLEAVPEFSHARIAFERIEAAAGELHTGTERRAGGNVSRAGESGPTPAQTSGAQAGPSVGLYQVTHSYRREAEDGIFQLGPLDLELRAGELVFLIGGNGSGKTTLAKLLVGLYEPQAGHVALGGVRIEAGAREAYRQNFSAVFSDFHLFDSLLRIEEHSSDARVGQLLAALDLSHKVRIDAGIFSTTALSTGQRKRLALLVALLEDRPVYVFDEWAADQDPQYKRVFYEDLLPELRARGKAVLVISHDERYFGVADRCLRLELGRLSPATSAV
jgi:putative ATP-binding cassette transporter